MSQSPERPGTSGGHSTAVSQTGSTRSRKSKSAKKKAVDPISLEEVFNQVSNIAASNLNPPPSRIVLTPRSAEVCLKLGINPEVVKIRDIDSFWEPGLEPAIQRLRHEAYVQRRYDVMKQCRLERKRILNAEFEAATTLAPSSTMTPEMLLAQQKEQSSTLIQMELARIEKMQKRQEKELESMIQYEVSRAQVQAEMEKRIQEAKRKEDLRKKQQEKRLKLMAEERRLRELQKVAMEEVEEENRRALAHEMHKKEMQLAKQAAERAKEQKRIALEQEIERKAKIEEQRSAVQRYFQEEQMRLRQRLDTLHLAEEKKQAAMLAKQKELAEQLRQKRAMIEQRIEHNMHVAQMVEEKRKNDFMEKTEHFESKRAEALRKEEEERQLHAQEIMLQEQRRRMILLQKRKEEELKAQGMLVKFEEEEEHVWRVQELREKEHQLARERKHLRTQMKLENVERVSRVGEYRRMGTLKKIEDTDVRVKTMLEQRQALIEDRRRAAANTKRQKESIAKVMEEVRTNASKAQKLITQALSGKVSLAALTGAGDSRCQSAEKKKKKKQRGDSNDGLGRSQSTAQLLGLGRDSVSAGESTYERPEVHKKYGLDESSASKPYVSPYDQPMVPTTAVDL